MRHNIFKVAANSWGRVDYLDKIMMKFIVNNRTDAWKINVNFFFLG